MTIRIPNKDDQDMIRRFAKRHRMPINRSVVEACKFSEEYFFPKFTVFDSSVDANQFMANLRRGLR